MGTNKSGAVNPSMSVFAPMTGKVVDISTLDDEAFSKKILGDGVAIIPEDGTVYSPVSGYITAIAKNSKHAFTFQTDDGLEIMVHVGIDTMEMDGSAFAVHVNEGARVQAGDLIADVDLNKITMAGYSPATPIIICGGMEGFIMHPSSGHVVAGAGAIFTLEDMREATPEELEKAEAKAKAERNAIFGLAEPEEKQKKKNSKKKMEEETASAMDFLNRPGGMLKAGLALLVITVLMVVCFVSIAMLTMHE